MDCFGYSYEKERPYDSVSRIEMSRDQLGRINVLGVLFDPITMDQLIERLHILINTKRQSIIAFSNPEFIVEAKKNVDLRDYLNSCDCNLADGWGVLWAARIIQNKTFPERITGTDFLPRLCDLCARNEFSIYFFGGEPGVAVQAAREMKEQFGNLKVAGVQHGFVADEDGLVHEINVVEPDVLMVCLGNPKQEEWICRNKSRLNVKLIFGNGGALDFHSKRVRRAPRAWENFHLEWLYRLLQDPNWKRVRRQLRLVSYVVAVWSTRLRQLVEKPKSDSGVF